MVRRLLTKLYHRAPVIKHLNTIRGQLTAIQSELHSIRSVNLARLLDFDLDAHPRYGDPRRLLRHQFQVTSQNGEDGIIHEIFRRIGAESRDFVEIGVGDGFECNTAFLLSLGWRGLWIDGSSDAAQTLQSIGVPETHLRHSASFVTRENVADLVRAAGVPTTFDLLSLDIDQNTYYIWEGLSEYRPRVVIVEYNAAIPPDTEWKVAYDPMRIWDGTQNFGASLKALELLGRKLGYSLVGCDFNGVNAFFVRDDLVADQFLAPFSAENHYEPPRYTFIQRRGHPRMILDRRDSTASSSWPDLA